MSFCCTFCCSFFGLEDHVTLVRRLVRLSKLILESQLLDFIWVLGSLGPWVHGSLGLMRLSKPVLESQLSELVSAMCYLSQRNSKRRAE